MPKVESRNDRAAKEGKIASHRWLGANTAAPLFYGQTNQVKATEDFLKADVLEVDIFALKRDSAGEVITPLNRDGVNRIMLAPGDELTAEVVVSNRNAAHSFPPEVRDLYEAWFEFQVLDASGKTIFHSGYVKADDPMQGMLDESAHVYKQIILDEQGRRITRHQIRTTNIKAYDNTINAGRSDVVRFRFRMPDGDTAIRRRSDGATGRRNDGAKFSRSFIQSAIPESPSAITLRARVSYRRLNQEYINYVLNRQKRRLKIPIVRMAEAETKLSAGGPTPVFSQNRSGVGTPEWKRWNDYGIGLLEQAQYGPAAVAFRRASELSPNDPNLLVNAAIAEMRTERFAHHERPQLQKAAELIDHALQIPQSAISSPHSVLRARYFRALIWRAEGKRLEAAVELKQIAAEYPRDREVQRQLAHTLYTLGQLSDARVAFETILKLDPTDAGAYQFLIPLYLGAGLNTESERAQAKYLLWRDDPQADVIAARFFAAHPEWADERIGSHVHEARSTQRPILTGQHATPDK